MFYTYTFYIYTFTLGVFYCTFKYFEIINSKNKILKVYFISFQKIYKKVFLFLIYFRNGCRSFLRRFRAAIRVLLSQSTKNIFINSTSFKDVKTDFSKDFSFTNLFYKNILLRNFVRWCLLMDKTYCNKTVYRTVFFITA